MADIRKSFSFRQGLQVDNDVLVVAGPLVGIGTTIPTEKLDIVGNLKVSGLSTLTSLKVSGISSFSSDVNIGNNIKIQSSTGIISATTYYGDGSNLSDLPTSQWIDIDVGLGFTSIYAQGNVGIATTDPRFTFQVGGNPNVQNGNGIGFNATGNVKSSGIITAAQFSGSGIGITEINASNISSGTIGNSYLPSNINVSGIITAAQFSGSGIGITQINASNISSGTIGNSYLPSNINISGILTASSGNFSGLVTSNSVSTNSVITGVLTATTGNFSGLVTSNSVSTGVLTASSGNFSGLVTSNSIRTGVLTATNGNFSGLVTSNSVSTGVITATDGTFVGFVTSNTLRTGVLTATTGNFSGPVSSDTVNTGVLTATNGTFTQDTFFDQKIGIGTRTTSSDIHLRRTSSQSILQITNLSNDSIISFGRSDNYLGYNGVLRYGNTSAIFPYSTPTSLDILNYGSGNINFYLEASEVGAANTGSFYWLRRPNFSELMALTFDAKLGIGKTDPNVALDVVGTSTVSSDSYVGQNLYVSGNISNNGNLTIGGILSVDSITANLTGNVYTTSGVSTFYNINASNFIGIGTTGRIQSIPESLSINAQKSSRVFVDIAGNIGIKTTVLPISGINAPTTDCIISGVGIGTTIPRCAVDFSYAANTQILGSGRDTIAYILPPKLTTTQRDNLTNTIGTGVETGALIYNTTSNRLEIRLPGGWAGISTIP